MAYKLYLAVAWLAAGAALVLSMPYEKDLGQVIHSAICKADIHYNTLEGRIPRVIKEVKCAPNPDAMCPKRIGSGKESCCEQNTFGGKVFTCTEVKDWVSVKPLGSDEELLQVSVGCACAHQTAVKTEEVD